VTLLRALMVPLAGLCAALAILIGGRPGVVLAVVSAVLFGVAALLIPMGV
jgi:hypothetical protein